MSKTIYVLSCGIQYPRIFHHKNYIKLTKAFYSLDEAKKEAKKCYNELEEQFISSDEYISFEKEYSDAHFNNDIEEHFDRMFIDTDCWEVIFIWTNVYKVELN